MIMIVVLDQDKGSMCDTLKGMWQAASRIGSATGGG